MRRWSLERPDCVQVLCGDFNSPKGNGNAVYKTLTGAELRDAGREAASVVGPAVRSTIHKFEGVAFEDAKGILYNTMLNYYIPYYTILYDN